MSTNVASLRVSRADPGDVLVIAEGQVNSENASADWVFCELRVDGSTGEERFTSLPANDKRTITASTVASLPAGEHVVTFDCRKGSSLSVIEFPEQRTRLSVLGG